MIGTWGNGRLWDSHVHHKLVIARWATCVWRNEVPHETLWAALAGAAQSLLRSEGLDWKVLTPTVLEDEFGETFDQFRKRKPLLERCILLALKHNNL
eukprot:6389142-Amphidinium_carterae.1